MKTMKGGRLGVFMKFEKFFRVVGAFLAASTFSLTASADLSAHDIMVKNDEVRRVTSAIATAEMVTGGPGATQKVKKFTWWRKLTADGIHFNTLTRFHLPAEVRNEGILFLEGGGETDIQLYLPNFKKIRRVETGQQSTSFMGSELSYSDIAPPHVDDFTYKIQKEEDCPGENKGVRCWVIEARPATDSVKERTGVSLATEWIRQDNFMDAKIDSDDAGGAHWKSMEASESREIDPKNHKWMSLHLHMTTLKTQHFTDLKFSDVKVTVMPDSTFTPQNLSKESP